MYKGYFNFIKIKQIIICYFKIKQSLILLNNPNSSNYLMFEAQYFDQNRYNL